MVMFWRYLIKPLTCLMLAIARMTLVHLSTQSIDLMPKLPGALALTKRFKFLSKRHGRLSNRPLSPPGPHERGYMHSKTRAGRRKHQHHPSLRFRHSGARTRTRSAAGGLAEVGAPQVIFAWCVGGSESLSPHDVVGRVYPAVVV